MCPAKTENLALNVCREEAAFWRRRAFAVKARSRGDLQKLLLWLGLRAVDPADAAKLAEIRRRYVGAALLLVFAVFLALGGDQDLRRARRRLGRRADEMVATEGDG